MNAASATNTATNGHISRNPKTKAMIAGTMTKGNPSFTINDSGKPKGHKYSGRSFRSLSLSYLKTVDKEKREKKPDAGKHRAKGGLSEETLASYRIVFGVTIRTPRGDQM